MPATAVVKPGAWSWWPTHAGLAALFRALFCAAAVVGVAACETMQKPRPSDRVAAADVAGLAAAADRAYLEGKWEEAEAGYRRLAETAPDVAEYWFRLGYICARQNRPGEAVRMYGKALEQDGNRLDAWHNLAMAQLQLAARSLGNIRARAPEDDPGAERAKRLINGITALLESERLIAIESALEQAP